MGCCQSSSMESEVVLDRNSPENPPLKPLNIINIPSDSEQKVAATPSFGTGNKNFVFDGKEKDLLYIN